MASLLISDMKFLFVLVQLETAVLYVNKHEANCTLLIVWHLLLFWSLLELKIWDFVLLLRLDGSYILNKNEPRVLI